MSFELLIVSYVRMSFQLLIVRLTDMSVLLWSIEDYLLDKYPRYANHALIL
jgi:hypothetical protein